MYGGSSVTADSPGTRDQRPETTDNGQLTTDNHARELPVTQEDRQLAALASEYGATSEALRALLASVRGQAGADHFYIYWTSGGGAAAPGEPAGHISEA